MSRPRKSQTVTDPQDVPRRAADLFVECLEREGVEYEFTIYFELNMNHTTTWSKNRTGLFADSGENGVPFTPSIKTGEEIAAWRKNGAIMSKPVEVMTPEKKAIYDEYYIMLDASEKAALKEEFKIVTKQDYYDKIPFESVKTQLNMKKEFIAKMAEGGK